MSAASIVYVPRLLADAVPTFHLPADKRFNVADTAEPDGTVLRRVCWLAACGRVMHEYTFRLRDGSTIADTYRERRTAHPLRRDHAETIGRLCSQCSASEA